MGLVYWFWKFSDLLLFVEIFLMSSLTALWILHWMLNQKRKGKAQQNIPDHVVHSFLTDLLRNTEHFKSQLFGERQDFHHAPPNASPTPPIASAEPTAFVDLSNTAATAPVASTSLPELEALQKQLSEVTQKNEELTKNLEASKLTQEELEKKVALNHSNQAASDGGASSKELEETKLKIQDLESRLSEYAIIEDDLANLKKYMNENKELKERLQALEQGAGTASAPATPAVTPDTAAPNVNPGAAETAPTTNVQPSTANMAQAAEAEAAEPASAAPASPLETAPTGASVAEPEELKKTIASSTTPLINKSDEDLLREFEKMLNS